MLSAGHEALRHYAVVDVERDVVGLLLPFTIEHVIVTGPAVAGQRVLGRRGASEFGHALLGHAVLDLVHKRLVTVGHVINGVFDVISTARERG